ncbi:MAG: tetratricopeptide repeat protein [Thermodesulfobacteriota bacterium]
MPNPVNEFTEKDSYIIGLRWYEYGDSDIAMKYWKPLAEDGDCDAEYGLGLLYFRGAGVRKSYNEARNWWDKSANYGQTQSQIALGVMLSHESISYSPHNCSRGCGVGKDLVTAYKWFGFASKMGSSAEQKQAYKFLEKIRVKMTPKQIITADNLIKEWEPAPSLCKPRRDLG